MYMVKLRNIISYSWLDRTVFFLFLIVICSLTASYETAHAKEHSIHIQFQYNIKAIPEKQVAGYNLYKADELICNTSISETENQDFECSFESSGGSFPFTLTALFNNGRESPHSAPFSLLLLDESTAVLGLQVLSGQTPEGTDGIGSQAGTDQIDMADVINMLQELPK